MRGQLTLVEAAARLGVSYSVVHRLALTGKLRAVKRGTRWIVESRSLRRLLRDKSRQSGSL
jgi:excisionase family DNA binding protein